MFLPSETRRLNAVERSRLEWRDGVIRPPAMGLGGPCGFFDRNAALHCTIFERRPLRCRLYPFLPVVEHGRIVIVADPFCSFSAETARPDWLRCYGLDQGPNVTQEIETLAREFLGRVLAEQPYVFIGYLCVDGVEELILSREVEKHRHPVVPIWDTERIRELAQHGVAL